MFSLLTLLISCFHTFTKHETLLIQLRISLIQSHIWQSQERQKIIKQQRHLFAGWTTDNWDPWFVPLALLYRLCQADSACYCRVKVGGGGGGGGGDGGRVETGGGPGGWGPRLVAGQCCCRRRRDQSIYTQHRDLWHQRTERSPACRRPASCSPPSSPPASAWRWTRPRTRWVGWGGDTHTRHQRGGESLSDTELECHHGGRQAGRVWYWLVVARHCCLTPYTPRTTHYKHWVITAWCMMRLSGLHAPYQW